MRFTYIFDQIRAVPENVYRIFVNYETQIREFGGIDLSLYSTADIGVVEAPDELTACERLYRDYNADNRPQGYDGRSMAVSDVVTLWNDNAEPPVKSVWFCDSVGFRRLK